MDLRHKSLPLQQQHQQQRGPPPLGFLSLMTLRQTTNTPFSCVTRVVALYPIPESHLLLLLFLLLLLRRRSILGFCLLFFLLWTFWDPPVTTATTNKKVLLLCSSLLNEVMWVDGGQKHFPPRLVVKHQ